MNQQTWEARVRAAIRAQGHDPVAEEADADGFGQDFAEWKSDPEGFANEVIRDNASRR